MKLSVVMGTVNQEELTCQSMGMLMERTNDRDNISFLVIDNGSDKLLELPKGMWDRGIKMVRNERNIGNYPLFKQGLEETDGDVIAFLHNDVFVYQDGWDKAVMAQFESRPDLGLLGFIGSTELDSWGGRGMGTTSNMQGKAIGRWAGSAGYHHGKVSEGMTIDGSVIDGCVMIFRRDVLEKIQWKSNFALHHFYDRLMSCQVIEMGYRVGILGIQFDHVSGQVANHEQKWQETSKEWFRDHLNIEAPEQWAELRKDWVNNANNPSRGKIPNQWDYCAYLENEYQFLKEYRDEKHLVPLIYGKRI